MRRKKVKIYIRHSQKNLMHYVDLFLQAYLGPSRTFMMQLFLRIQLLAVHYFCNSAPSQMFDWVLNRLMVLIENHSISLILANRWQRCFCGFIVFLVAIVSIYCINPSNVEFFEHTWFHRELVKSIMFARKMGFHFNKGKLK